MSKRPWHEQVAALVPLPWWLAFALGAVALAQSAGPLIGHALGHHSVGPGDLAMAVVGLVGGGGWVVMAYAKRRHRQAAPPP